MAACLEGAAACQAIRPMQPEEGDVQQKTDVTGRAIRQMRDLKEIEARLEEEPLALLGEALGLAPRQEAPSSGLEAAAPDGDGEIRAATEQFGRAVARSAQRAVAKVRRDGEDADLSADEEVGLEAIILLTGRPAILIVNGSFARPPEEWRKSREHSGEYRGNLQERRPHRGHGASDPRLDRHGLPRRRRRGHDQPARGQGVR